MPTEFCSVLTMAVNFRLPAEIKVIAATFQKNGMPPLNEMDRCEVSGTFKPGSRGCDSHMDLTLKSAPHQTVPYGKLHHEGYAMVEKVYIGWGGQFLRVVLNNGWNLVLDVPLTAFEVPLDPCNEDCGKISRYEKHLGRDQPLALKLKD